MYIGIVSFNKDIVDRLIINAYTEKEATEILAKHVYENYNKGLPIDGHHYFDGIVINTVGLASIGREDLENEFDEELYGLRHTPF